MTFKKIIKSVLTLTAVFLLAACGNDGGSSSAAGTDGETVEIAFWHAMNGPNQETLTALTEEFNNSQDRIEIVEANQGDYGQLQNKITASAASNQLPVMSQVTTSHIPDFAESGIISPLSDLLTSVESGFTQEEVDDIVPGFLEGVEYNDDIYAMPFSKSIRVVHVNLDILEDYDVEIPKTWADIKELGEKMVANGDSRTAMGVENDFTRELETAANQNGAEWLSNDLQTVDMGSDAAVEPLQFIQDGIEAGWARTAGEDGFVSGPFGRGEVAIYFGASSGAGFIQPLSEESGMTWTSAELPVFNNGEQQAFIGGNEIAIFESASDEEKAAAIEYIHFLLQPENTARWAIETGYVPVTNAGLNSDTYQEYIEENPQAQAAVNSTAYAQTQANFLGSSQYLNDYLSALDQVTTNGGNPKDELTALQESLEEIISENY